ncbi:MAG: hypothetical protein HY365_00700 [Candidatus Aenigmarchaeota archaeon]|nr:hypothetical protein [Candidatus Aenigmarchaeota archaeon]
MKITVDTAKYAARVVHTQGREGMTLTEYFAWSYRQAQQREPELPKYWDGRIIK